MVSTAVAMPPDTKGLPLAAIALYRRHTRAAENQADKDVLASASQRVRGLRLQPEQPLLLRLSRIAPPELHAGRSLRRLLLCRPIERPDEDEEALESQEVEAELLLWDDEQKVVPMLPRQALLCLFNFEGLTDGDPTPGGAPAQLACISGATGGGVDEAGDLSRHRQLTQVDLRRTRMSTPPCRTR